MHTLIMQRATGKMVRTNILLAIFTFLLVMYGTFLTRSGVLADFFGPFLRQPGNIGLSCLGADSAERAFLGYFF